MLRMLAYELGLISEYERPVLIPDVDVNVVRPEDMPIMPDNPEQGLSQRPSWVHK